MFRSRRSLTLRDSASPAKRLSLRELESPAKRLGLRELESPAKRLSLRDSGSPANRLSLRESGSPAKRLSLRESVSPAKRPKFEESPSEARVETPPPTPEVRKLCTTDNLAKQKSILRSESVELDNEIEQKLTQLAVYAEEFALVKDRRSKYDDYVFMVKRLGDKIRNQLNSIFNPGTEFAQRFEDTAKEMQSNHRRRFETKSLEWNNSLDQLRSAMSKKAEELKHEIELHRRTLEHNKHLEDMTKAANEMNEVERAIEQGSEKKEPGSAESAQSFRRDPVNIDDDIQGANNIDCITLDESDDANVEREEIITEQSVNMSEVKQEADEDATDVEDNQDEEMASFTPRQAQRVD